MNDHTYTAKDFGKARFAAAGDRVAMKADPENGLPWVTDLGNRMRDAGMALDGWTPVREAVDLPPEVKENLRASRIYANNVALRAEAKRLKERREGALDANRSLRAQLERLEERLDDKRAENDRLIEKLKDLRNANTDMHRLLQEEREANSARLTLDSLAAAWEGAEVPTDDDPIRDGDVVILPVAGGYVVRPVWGDKVGNQEYRVLSRAPQREPWADLADVLVAESVVFDSEDASIAARALHSAGVRVMGGDDDE